MEGKPNWTIRFDPPPVPSRDFDWVAVHDGTDHCIYTPTRAELLEAIDEWEEDNA